MSYKRGLGKKGQEGMSLTTIAVLVLVLIVVVLLVLGLMGVLNPIFEKFNLFPGSGLSGIVTACNTYVQVQSKTDYCMFRETKVNGKTEWVNCMDTRVQNDLDASNKGVYPTCDTDTINSVRQQCITLFKDGKKNPRVDNQPCGSLTPKIICGEDFLGDILTSGSCPSNRREVTGYSGTEKCCVPVV